MTSQNWPTFLTLGVPKWFSFLIPSYVYSCNLATVCSLVHCGMSPTYMKEFVGGKYLHVYIVSQANTSFKHYKESDQGGPFCLIPSQPFGLVYYKENIWRGSGGFGAKSHKEKINMASWGKGKCN